jgi:hypothetical protein
VVAISAKNVWAVGWRENTAGHQRTLIEHWDGVGWQLVPSPNHTAHDNVLNGIVPVPGHPALLWAVGYHSTALGGLRPLVLRLRGGTWSVITTLPKAPAGQLVAGAATGTTGGLWLVGIHYREGLWHPLAFRRRRSGWQRVPTSTLGVASFSDATVIPSTNQVWVVGDRLHLDGTLIVRWDGTGWRTGPRLDRGPSGVGLGAVTAISPRNAWAVGDRGSVPDHPLVLHYH